MLFLVFFFFKQKTAYEMRISDWSSDVCSSDLDDVLRQIARDIGRRAIDLGRILARKRAAAVRGGAAIGIDDDLAPGDAGVAVRPADLEQPGRVDVDRLVLGQPAVWQHVRGHDRHVIAQRFLALALATAGDGLGRYDARGREERDLRE